MQIHVRRGDHARIDRNRFRAADALNLPLLQNAQQFGLRFERQLADFIQEDGPAMSLFKVPRARIRRARKRALRVPEQFRFHQVLRNRRAIDRHHFGFRTAG